MTPYPAYYNGRFLGFFRTLNQALDNAEKRGFDIYKKDDQGNTLFWWHGDKKWE